MFPQLPTGCYDQVHPVGDTRSKVISFQFSVVSYEFGVMSFVQVHPGGSVATEGSGGGVQPSTAPPDASSLAGSFLQHGFTTVLDCGSSPK
ncbi:MAG: hypothetical protein FWF18_01660 [Dehalococcoidia bacterium]|nr:hypothetical protein [Dehalococcoidia bacterium]